MIAFLIIAHQDALQLKRLVLSLSKPFTKVFVHIDKKVDIEPFRKALQGLVGVTLITARVRVYWGGFSQVQATLNLIDAAQKSQNAFSHFCLLSGACYPIQSLEDLNAFLLSSGSEHIETVPMPSALTEKPISRLTQWRFEGGDRMRGFIARSIRYINRLCEKLPPKNIDKALGTYRPYAGSQWWVLTSRGIEEVIRKIKEKPKFVALYKHSHCPDESFFQTILGNSSLPNSNRRGLTFSDWTNPRERPDFFNASHLRSLKDTHFIATDKSGSGPVFFARKFSSKNSTILDLIDAHIRNN